MQAEPIPPGLASSYVMAWLALSQTVIFLTAVTTLIFNYLRDGRSRRWLEKDRAYEQDRSVAAMKSLTDHTSLTSESLKVLALDKLLTLQTQLTMITAEIVETKKAAGDAYKEANHVNNKISEYNQRLLETRGDPPPQPTMVDPQISSQSRLAG